MPSPKYVPLQGVSDMAEEWWTRIYAHHHHIRHHRRMGCMINLTGRCNAAAASAATITLIYLCAQSSISSTCTKHNVFPPLFNTLHCTHISGVALEFCDYPFGNILSFAHLVHFHVQMLQTKYETQQLLLLARCKSF